MADFRISTFTSKLSGGGARTNLMEMSLGTVPGGGVTSDVQTVDQPSFSYKAKRSGIFF